MEPTTHEAADLLTSNDGLVLNWIPNAPPGIRGFLTTRVGGRSQRPWDSLNVGSRVGDDPDAVRENLRLVGRTLGMGPATWVRVDMEHGSRVLQVDESGFAGRADGLLTTRPGLPLTITLADCFPLFLWAPGSGAALLHCGWKGIARGIVEEGVKGLRLLAGASARDLGGWIGPGIQACCYEVGWDVAIQVSPQPPPYPKGSSRVHLDLAKEIHERLLRIGMSPSAVQVSGHCTSCRPDLYFSHRRDQGRTGRMLAVLVRAGS